MTSENDLHTNAECFTKNLDALSAHQPKLVELFRSLPIPDTVIPVLGRDGTPTFRLLDTTGRRIWLGHSSMPSVSSVEIVRQYETGSTNLLVPSIGHGWEIRHLLERIGFHQAVFTYDPDPLVVVLALRLHGFSDAISRGRLILAVGPDPLTALVECFQTCPTHLPPMKMPIPPFLDSAMANQLQAALETAANQHGEFLLTELRALQPQLRAFTPNHRNVSIVSLIPDPQLSSTAAALAAAARKLDLHPTIHLADRPAQMSFLSVARFLLENRPQSVILLNQVRGELNQLVEAVPHCASWCVSSSADRVSLFHHISSCEVLYVRDSAMIQRLKEKSPSSPMTLLPPAADVSVFHPDPIPSNKTCDAVIVLDAYPLQAKAIGLNLTTHQEMFDILLRLLRSQFRCHTHSSAESVLEQACREAHVHFDAPEIRHNLISIISERLAPTLMAIEIARSLTQRGLKVGLWGHHWNFHEEMLQKVPCYPAPTPEIENQIYNSSTVVIHLRNDEVHEQQLLNALASQAIVFRLQDADSHANEALTLPDVWSLIPACTSVGKCLEGVRSMLKNRSSIPRQMQAAHLLVREKHLMSNRLALLLEVQ